MTEPQIIASIGIRGPNTSPLSHNKKRLFTSAPVTFSFRTHDLTLQNMIDRMNNREYPYEENTLNDNLQRLQRYLRTNDIVDHYSFTEKKGKLDWTRTTP